MISSCLGQRMRLLRSGWSVGSRSTSTELLARRLVYLVHAGELEPVEPDTATAAGAHVHRYALGHHRGHGAGAHRTLDDAGGAGIRQPGGVRLSRHLRPFQPFLFCSPDIVSTPQTDVLEDAIL